MYIDNTGWAQLSLASDSPHEQATIITCISWAGAMTKAMPPTWPR